MAMQSLSVESPLAFVSESRSCFALSSCQSASVKIGGLWKRAQGGSRFTKSNYKHRVFILTDQALSYYAGTVDRVGQMKGRVLLESVRAVEFVDLSAFNLAHTMQVVHVSKKTGFMTLYIIATTKEECSDWVATLRQACYFNRDMLMHYHPGAFVKSKWTCCHQRGRTILGCQPTYHLLTRSSSRYAQMRRKDTLTSSTNGHRRATRAASRGSRAYSDHRSTVTTAAGASTDVEDTPGYDARSPCCRCGLSNSFMELSMHPPHTDGAFTLSSPPRSSKNSSTEHSVGVGTMALARVSVSEGAAGEVEDGGGLSHPSTPKHAKAERGTGRRSGRSQVGPTSSPGRREHILSYELEPRTLPSTFRSRRSNAGLNNSWNHSMRSQERVGPVGGEEEEVDPHPVPPPRLKKGLFSPTIAGHAATLGSSPLCSPPLCSPPSKPVLSGSSKLKHSKTFANSHSAEPPRVKTLQGTSCAFSQSMGTLMKPIIEPKLSMSNPNVIHV